VISTFVSRGRRGRRGLIPYPQAVLRGRHGTHGLGGVPGSDLGAPWSCVTPRYCAWQAWYLVTSSFVLCGRRGAISHPQVFCVAGVAGTHGTGGALGCGLGAPW